MDDQAQNLSRLSTRWEESIHTALWAVETKTRRRLEELTSTVEPFVADGAAANRALQLRADLERLEQARKFLAAEIRS